MTSPLILTSILSKKKKHISVLGMPWRSSSYDLALSLPRVWARSLVRELRSHKLCGAAGIRKVHYPRVGEGDLY